MFIYSLLTKSDNKERFLFVNDKQQITYLEMIHILKKSTLALIKYGLQKGTVVILPSTDQFHFAICLLCLLHNGFWVVPLKNKKEYELINNIKPFKTSELFDVQYFFTLLEQESAKYPHIPISPHEESGIFHITSGSMGEPKFCMRTIENLFQEAISYTQTYHFEKGEFILSVPPLAHSFALGGALFAALACTGTLYTVDHFHPRILLRLLEQEPITCLFLVPYMARLIVESVKGKTHQFSGLSKIIVGAGQVDKKTFSYFREEHNIFLNGNYGSTETGGLIARVNDHNYKALGKPMEGVQVKLYDEEKKLIDSDGVGELYIKCGGMMRNYLNKNEVDIFDPDGFYKTGDIIRREGGTFYFVARKNRITKVGGVKISLDEIETAALQIPIVSDCVVFEHMDQNSTVNIAMFVVTSEKISQQKIRCYLTEKIEKIKIPKFIFLFDKIPRDELGKVSYKKLQSIFSENSADQNSSAFATSIN